MATKAKDFHYAVSQDRAGRLDAEGSELEPATEWTPEHLVLAGLVRCTLESLRFHARRVGIDFVASAAARGRVTKRDGDGRYAFVEVAVDLDLELEPEPDDLAGLLQKAERDCFVGASLTAKPEYRWRVNSRDAGG